MIRRPPRSTRTDTLFPYTTLFRSHTSIEKLCVIDFEIGVDNFLVAHSIRRIWDAARSEEHTSELQSLMRISYAVFCLKKNNHTHNRQSEPVKHHSLKPTTDPSAA